MICWYITALYGVLFSSESEAAFSNYRLWESLGFVMAFGYSFYLCAAVKIYILTTTLIIGITGYLAAECLHRTTRLSTADTGDISNDRTSSDVQQETACEKLVAYPLSFARLKLIKLFKNVFIRSVLTRRYSALETLCLCAI